LNWGIKVLQTSALPLGYAAKVFPVFLSAFKKDDHQRQLFILSLVIHIWSGKRDSNSRPSPWQGDALPLSYFRMFLTLEARYIYINPVSSFKFQKWCHEPESNQRHEDFQSSALPTELSWRVNYYNSQSHACQYPFQLGL
jgi:hypothetical protein